jgi:hypothetical protein
LDQLGKGSQSEEIENKSTLIYLNVTRLQKGGQNEKKNPGRNNFHCFFNGAVASAHSYTASPGCR